MEQHQDKSEQSTTSEAQSFEDSANEPEMGLFREFLLFLREHKAWWLVPIMICLALLGLAVWIGSSPVAPLIYPLF